MLWALVTGYREERLSMNDVIIKGNSAHILSWVSNGPLWRFKDVIEENQDISGTTLWSFVFPHVSQLSDSLVKIQ